MRCSWRTLNCGGWLEQARRMPDVQAASVAVEAAQGLRRVQEADEPVGEVAVSAGRNDQASQLQKPGELPVTVAEWIRVAPESVKAWLTSVPALNFLRLERNACFQLARRYDGAMSDECKAAFQGQYEAVNEILAALGDELADGR